MNIRKHFPIFSTLLLLLLSCALRANPSLDPGDNQGNDLSLSSAGCELPAPTNFHAIFIGPDRVWVEWDQPPVLPHSYNIQVFESGNPPAIQDFDIAGNKTNWLIQNLVPNTKYRIVLTPKCGKDRPSKEPADLDVTTIITDLIVSGFTPSNDQPDLPISSTNPYYTGTIGLGEVVTFRLHYGTNVEGYIFGLFRGYGTCNNVLKLLVNERINQGDYKMLCDGNIAATCTGTTVSIISGGVALATIFYAQGSSTQYLLGASFAENYKISRLGAPVNQSTTVGACGANILGRPSLDREIPLNTDTKTALFANPNPFSDQLEVNIPYSSGKENIDIVLYDLGGRLVMAEHFPGDRQTISLNTTSLTPGMYYLRAESGGIAQTVKIVKTP